MSLQKYQTTKTPQKTLKSEISFTKIGKLFEYQQFSVTLSAFVINKKMLLDILQ